MTPIGAKSPLTEQAKRIEELFAQQVGRISFHLNSDENDYRAREERLSSLVVDQSIPAVKHLEYAEAILKMVDAYKKTFVEPLQQLDEEIQRELATFERILHSASAAIHDSAQRSECVRWLALSNELQQARLMATNGISRQVGFDTTIPIKVIQNDGRSDLTFSTEDQKEFTEGFAAVGTLIKASFEANQRICAERDPLTSRLFSGNVQAKADAIPSPSAPRPAAVHPLEGKVWFRLIKVLYFALWTVGLVVSAAFGYATNNVLVFAVGVVISAVSLIILKKVFYYVTLGRVTATEQPGEGFVDLEDLRHDLAAVQANNPEIYQEVVVPFLEEWKARYGRRVPLYEMNILQQRATREVERLKQEKKKMLEQAASRGATIELSALRKNLEQSIAAYEGSDRTEYIRQLELFLVSLEVKHGKSIPIDEADKILEKLDADIRTREAGGAA